MVVGPVLATGGADVAGGAVDLGVVDGEVVFVGAVVVGTVVVVEGVDVVVERMSTCSSLGRSAPCEEHSWPSSQKCRTRRAEAPTARPRPQQAISLPGVSSYPFNLHRLPDLSEGGRVS